MPSGLITLHEGGVVVATAAVAAKGGHTLSTSSLTLGTHLLVATYGGDANYLPSDSNVLTVVVQKAASTTALGSSLNPQILGQTVTIAATVASSSANVTGTVSLSDGATALGSATVSAAGVASFAFSTLSFGPHALTATYAGDANHAGSTSTVLNQKIVQASPIALSSSVNPATAGTGVVLTARLPGAASLIPSGLVTFLDGANVIGTGALDAAGAASFATSSLPVGSHSITSRYPGDANFSSVTSTVLIETVQSATTQIALSASANPAVYGAPLTLTAAITTNGATATGTATFVDGGTSLGTTLVNGSGAAVLTLSTLVPGPHSIVVNYSGDSGTSPSTSVPLTVVVKQITSVALASSANPASTLSAVTLTASVRNAGAGAATGSVTFTDGSTQLGSAQVDAQGNAAISVPQFSAGNHPIVAAYAGDGLNFASASATLTQGISLRATNTTLTASLTSATNTQQVTLIAVVRWNGPATPTGKVTFASGTNVLGSVGVDATGVATLTIFVPSGTQTVVASYGGDAAYANSDSPVTSVSGGVATQFTMSLNPNSVSVPSKQHSTVDVTITSVKGFADTMQFGCLGLPFAATCTFNNTQMKLPPDGVKTVQLTIDTGHPLGAGGLARDTHGQGTGVLFCFLPGALVAGFLMRRKGRSLPALTALALMLGMGAMLSATGCQGLQINGTPAGTYSFKISATGTGTGASSSQNMTLTVTE